MDLSTLVVNYRSGDLLGACLSSLGRAEEGLRTERFVVDNDPEAPGVPDALEARRVVTGGNLGFAKAVNLGLALASGRYVLLLNPDVSLTKGRLDRALDFLDGNPRIAAAGFRLLDPGGRLQPSCRRFPGWSTAFSGRRSLLRRLLPSNPLTRRYLMGDFNHDSPRSVDWVSGACLLIRRSALVAVGGLDERFFLYCEDVDLCLRLWQSGREVWYLPWVEGCHLGGASARHRPLASLLDHHRSMWTYYRKHLSRGWPVDLPVAAGVALRALMAGAGTLRLSSPGACPGA